jgi:GNAT superfamily N-acetyltransferase
MPEIFYHSPRQNIEQNGHACHTVEIREGKILLGGADIEYFSKPIPFYQISALWTEYEHRGKGYGSKVMEYIERLLKEKRKAGFLVDAIDSDSPAKGFYARRGWIKVPDSFGQYVFNLPKNVGPEIFQNVQCRGTS